MNNSSKLFIPNKIKVGFQERSDTYTKKLAYVIYYDKKGVLRKETSWQNWRDKKIDSVEFDNTPTEGFVLNKGVGGGGGGGYRWHHRNEYIRVYDPRDFEFEISVANLLLILRECDCSRGKGLEGKFVYGWDKKDLVLLPECSTDYKESVNFTELQGQKVNAKDLIPGATYLTKDTNPIVYIGKYDYWESSRDGKKSIKNKKFIFHSDNRFIILNDIKSISKLSSDSIIVNLAELIDKYYKSPNGSKIVELILLEKKHKYHQYRAEIIDGVITILTPSPYDLTTEVFRFVQQISIKDGIIESNYPYYGYSVKNIILDKSKKEQYLYAKLASGEIYPINGSYCYSD